MLQLLDLSGANWPAYGITKNAIPRSQVDVDSVLPQAKKIIELVKNGTEEDILDLTEQFDGIRPKSLRVPDEIIQSAVNSASADFIAALKLAADRVRKVSENQKREQIQIEVIPGGKVTTRWVPINRVGLYVPGGKAVYPSSVVMNVVPAQVAGVTSMMIMSPPNRDNYGWPHQSILTAAGLLGVTEIYAVGGAQAIAMATFGIGCDAVDLITGPGNIYVTAAKRALSGQVGFDSEAGPTEVAIIADQTANPKYVAADLISQAEHDVVAAAVLITDSKELIDQVNAELEIQVAQTKHKDRIRTALTGQQSMSVLVTDIDQAVIVANAYAAEHLEIQTTNAMQVANKITNAGAVFVGDYSPVSLGDYLAGSNHVLPTGGCACHTEGLSIETFLKLMNVVEYSQSALADSAESIEVLAISEDLPAHWSAIEKRFSGDSQ